MDLPVDDRFWVRVRWFEWVIFFVESYIFKQKNLQKESFRTSFRPSIHARPRAPSNASVENHSSSSSSLLPSVNHPSIRLRVRSSTTVESSTQAHTTGSHPPPPSQPMYARASISGAAMGIRQPISLRAGGVGGANKFENRRWSLASLPSSSGYGTPESNSAFSVSTI